MALTGKTFLVTGAASGIGRAIALQANAAGAKVIAADLSESGLDTLQRDLPGAVCVRADVSKAADVDRIMAAAGNRLDVLCNNAGLMDRHMLVDELPDEEWERVVGVNLTGPFLLCKRAVPLMVAHGGGSIVNISSIAGIRGGRAGVAYTATKHGLIGMTKSIAATFGAQKIRCNAVCPGGTRFGAMGAHEPGVKFSERGSRLLIGRDRDKPEPGTPEGIATVVMFLADDALSWRVNGAVITADDAATAF